VVLQTIAVPVLVTPVAPATEQVALRTTVGFAVADVVVFVGVGVVVVVEGFGVVGSGVVEVFTGSVALVVGALLGSVAFVVGALVGSVLVTAGTVFGGVLLGSVAVACAMGAGWLGSVALGTTRAVVRTSDVPENGRCLSGSEEATRGAAMAPTATSDRSPPPTMPSFTVRWKDFQ
jgi:hypothetical protein